MMKHAQLTQIGCFLALSALTSTCYAGDDTFDKIVDAGKQITQSAYQSQQRVDQLHQQAISKLQQFKTLNKEIDGLQVYNQQMQAQIDNQLSEIAQLAESMQQVSIIERQISPLMARMIDTLANFVELDIPFLADERSKRISDLQKMLTRADVTVSEKFRRVLEAYQIEVDYGRTIEAYSGLLNLDGQERDVDFLRIGRVSFVYQTRDGSKLGLWDQQQKRWQALPASYRLDINKGLRIARKQLAPDLLTVPLAP